MLWLTVLTLLIGLSSCVPLKVYVPPPEVSGLGGWRPPMSGVKRASFPRRGEDLPNRTYLPPEIDVRGSKPVSKVPPPLDNEDEESNSVYSPSPCVWALVSCCEQHPSTHVNYSCFERLGCFGAFLDNPCMPHVKAAALKAISKYYH